MRLISSITISLALLSSATLAQQQTPGPSGGAIGRPPPLPAPPPITAPAMPPTAGPAPQASDPAPKAPGTVPTSPLKDPLAVGATGPGLNVPGPDGATKTVKAVPCSTAARETDGTTTCVGIPDQSPRRKRR